MVKDLEKNLEEICSHFKAEVATLRTGRANIALVENIKVQAYDGSSPLALKELATINVPEPRLILIDPWDKTVLSKIEKALQSAPGLGGSPVVDELVIRLPLPPLSEERRRESVKLLKSILERCRQQIRGIRQAEMKKIEEEEEGGLISEDEKFARKKEVEEAVKKAHESLEESGKRKEEEIIRL